MNLEAVAALPARPIASVWYRAVNARHLPAVLSYSHTRLFASRFYAGQTASEPFETLYLAENPLVAQFEVKALLGSPLIPGGIVPNPGCSWLIANAEVQLAKIADLTNLAACESLVTTAQELTGDWEGYAQRRQKGSVVRCTCIAPTQELEAALYGSALFEGFLTFSAKLPYHLVLGVFPHRIAKDNFDRYRYQDVDGQPQILEIPATAPSQVP